MGSTTGRMRAVAAVVIVVGAVAATSMGGLGALAAPVLVPLLVWVAHRGGRLARWSGGVVAAVLGAEVGLALVHVIGGGAQGEPVAWGVYAVVPLVLGAGALWWCVGLPRRAGVRHA